MTGIFPRDKATHEAKANTGGTAVASRRVTLRSSLESTT